MPPGQPVLECEGCGFYRPCKQADGEWLCVECNPYIDTESTESTDRADAGAETSSEAVATDGGHE